MSNVPTLRAALQDAADRRYGRRHRVQRWSAMALVPGLAAAALAVLVILPGADRERTPEPAGPVHTERVTELPPRPRAPFRIVEPTALSRAEGLAAQAKAANTSADQGPLVRAWTVPGMQGAAIFLTRGEDQVCVSAREPASGDFPGQWAASCGGRDSGIGLAIGDTYVGVLGSDDDTTPTYRAPGREAVRLRPNADGLVVIQGAADGARVRISEWTPDTIEIGRDARYHCSDGTTLDVRVNNLRPGDDPCAP